MVACEDAVNELYDQERDLIKQKLDNVLKYYNDLDSYMSSIVSKMDSFISLVDDMGKCSSLTDLLEQFAAANELISELTSDKEQAVTGVQNTGTYKKLLNDIAKAKLALDKQEDVWRNAYQKDPSSRQTNNAQKKLDQLATKLGNSEHKRDDITQNASANNVAEYSKLYDQQKKLLDKQETLRNRLLKDLKKAQTDYCKQREVVDSIDPEKDRNGKKTEAALKKLQQLSDKMGTLQDKYISGTLLLSKSEITNLEKIQSQMVAISEDRNYNNAVLNSEDPFSDKTVEKTRKKLAEIKDLINSDSGWDKYAPVTDSVFEQADTRLLDFNDDIRDTCSQNGKITADQYLNRHSAPRQNTG